MRAIKMIARIFISLALPTLAGHLLLRRSTMFKTVEFKIRKPGILR
jgi:hypothetical protein